MKIRLKNHVHDAFRTSGAFELRLSKVAVDVVDEVALWALEHYPNEIEAEPTEEAPVPASVVGLMQPAPLTRAELEALTAAGSVVAKDQLASMPPENTESEPEPAEPPKAEEPKAPQKGDAASFSGFKKAKDEKKKAEKPQAG